MATRSLDDGQDSPPVKMVEWFRKFRYQAGGTKKAGSLKAPRRSCVADALCVLRSNSPFSIAKDVTDQNPHPDLQCSANALISVWTVDRRAGFEARESLKEKGGKARENISLLI